MHLRNIKISEARLSDWKEIEYEVSIRGMVRVPKSLDITHLPLLSLVPRANRPVTDVKEFSSSYFVRLEAVSDVTKRDNARKTAQRDMLEQVQRWIELQRAGQEGAS